MGDRANVFFVDSRDGDKLRGVYLYSHWGGTDFQADAITALTGDVARKRWGDEPYLARIVIQSVMNKNFKESEATGGGLSTGLCDNNHPILVIDGFEQQVRLMKEGEEDNAKATPLAARPFTEAHLLFGDLSDDEEYPANR